MADKYAGILERLGVAKEGTWELDAEIHYLLGGEDTRGDERLTEFVCKGYTRSVDAALTLFPPGFAYVLRSPRAAYEQHAVDLIKTGIKTEYGAGFSFVGEPIPAATAALSMCIASLRARQAVEDREGE